MKICAGCKTEKPLSDFYRAKRLKDGRQPQCKICMRDYYNNSRNKKKEHYRAVQRRREHRNIDRLNEWKEEQGCACCPETVACCLEPHHLDPNEKDFNVSDKARHVGWDTLMKELNKCIIVCRNCHAKIHAGVLRVAQPG